MRSRASRSGYRSRRRSPRSDSSRAKRPRPRCTLRPALPAEPTAAADDTPDAWTSIDPQGDALRARVAAMRRAEQQTRREEAAREREAKARERRIAAVTPGYVLPMRWVGAGIGGAGLIAVVYSSAKFDPKRTTRSEFDTLQLVNDIGWVAFGVGAAAFAVSWLLMPADPGERKPAESARARIDLGPGQLQLQVAY